MNRHEDELEKEIADNYIENMDAPDLWGRIESGLDAVDAHRAQDKSQAYSHDAYENRKTAENRIADGKVTDIGDGSKGKNRRIAQIISGLVAAAVVCVLIIAGPLRNSRKLTADKTAQDNSAMITSDENTGGDDMAAENDTAFADDYSISDSETSGRPVSNKPVVVTSDQQGDYAPMIMVDGVLYKDTYDMVDADSVDESKALYAESYTDGMPANDGEVNFDRNPSRNSAYVVCEDGSLIVKVEGNWYRFERAD